MEGDEPNDREPEQPAHVTPATPLLKEGVPESWEGPDPITWVKHFDHPTVFPFPVDLWRATVGSAREKADFVLDLEAYPKLAGLSGLHCILERRAGGIRVVDASSTNGTEFKGRRDLREFMISPGDCFRPRPATLIALNKEMWAARPLIAQITGSDPRLIAHELRLDQGAGMTVDEIITRNAEPEQGFMVSGEPGCEQEELARALHRISLRRNRPEIVVSTLPERRAEQQDLLRAAEHTTLIVLLPDDQPPIDAAFRDALFSKDYHITVMLLASMSAVAERLFPGHTRRMESITLRPLAHRLKDVEPLFDELMDARGTKLRLRELPDADQTAIRRYNWAHSRKAKLPGNLAELRRFVDEYAAYRETGTMERAAVALKAERYQIRNHFQKIGISATS